jgi:hypothetical protein
MSADTTPQALAQEDGSYVSRSAKLDQRRHRRLFTFDTPIRIRAEVRYGDANAPPHIGLYPLQAPADLVVRWAEGTDEDTNGEERFLVLDVLGADQVCWPDPVVGVWVRPHNIASAQVQIPIRYKPGAPRSITDLAQCDRYVAQGRCELRQGHRGSHRSGKVSWD